MKISNQLNIERQKRAMKSAVDTTAAFNVGELLRATSAREYAKKQVETQRTTR